MRTDWSVQTPSKVNVFLILWGKKETKDNKTSCYILITIFCNSYPYINTGIFKNLFLVTWAFSWCQCSNVRIPSSFSSLQGCAISRSISFVLKSAAFNRYQNHSNNDGECRKIHVGQTLKKRIKNNSATIYLRATTLHLRYLSDKDTLLSVTMTFRYPKKYPVLCYHILQT